MIFKSIQAQNFLSFNRFNLNLENRGLLLLNGENLDNPVINNNGAGKSSIIESIVYALYGKTLRGLKGESVIHRLTEKDTQVALNLIDDDGSDYLIIRNRKHSIYKNKSLLYRNGQDITPKSELDFEKYISTLLQADYNSFTSSLLYSAESFKFATATDGEIKKIFDTMLGLDILQKSHEIVKNRLKNILSETHLYEINLDFKTKSIQNLEEKINSLTTSKEEYDEQEKIKQTQLNQSIIVLQDKLVNLLREKSELEKIKQLREKNLNQAKDILQSYKNNSNHFTQLKIENEKIKGKIANISLIIESNKKELTKLITSIEQLKLKIENYTVKKANLEKNIGAPCSLCGQPLTIQAIEPSKKEFDKKIEELTNMIFSILKEKDEILQKIAIEKENIIVLQTEQSDIEDLLGTYKDFEDKFIQAEKNVDKMQVLLDEVNTNIKIKTVNIKENEKIIEQLLVQLQSAKNYTNPFIELLQSAVNDKQTLQLEIEDLKQKILLMENYKKDLNFWEVGFSNQGIKSYILDSITPFLNRRLNKYLTKLTSGQIEAIFSTTSTLKSGEFRERFNLSIINNSGGKDYIANSGGEKKRIDLSINLALQDLIASRSTKKLNIAIFDEVFDSLDENGVDGVISLLQELSKEKSTILLVSHNEYLKSYFTNIVTVIKQNGFSRILEV